MNDYVLELYDKFYCLMIFVFIALMFPVLTYSLIAADERNKDDDELQKDKKARNLFIIAFLIVGIILFFLPSIELVKKGF